MQVLLRHFLVLCIVAVASVSAAVDLPVIGAVTSGVGWRPDPFGTGRMVYHRGIDIAVQEGTPVRPTGAGTVMHAGPHAGHGLTVIVSHADGSETLYGHNSKILVAKGERVGRETVLALSGNSGRSTGPHVHYEVRGKGILRVPQPAMIAITAGREDLSLHVRMQSEKRLLEVSDSLRESIYGFRPVANTPVDVGPEDEV